MHTNAAMKGLALLLLGVMVAALAASCSGRVYVATREPCPRLNLGVPCYQAEDGNYYRF